MGVRLRVCERRVETTFGEIAAFDMGFSCLPSSHRAHATRVLLTSFATLAGSLSHSTAQLSVQELQLIDRDL